MKYWLHTLVLHQMSYTMYVCVLCKTLLCEVRFANDRINKLLIFLHILLVSTLTNQA